MRMIAIGSLVLAYADNHGRRLARHQHPSRGKAHAYLPGPGQLQDMGLLRQWQARHPGIYRAAHGRASRGERLHHPVARLYTQDVHGGASYAVQHQSPHLLAIFEVFAHSIFQTLPYGADHGQLTHTHAKPGTCHSHSDPGY